MLSSVRIKDFALIGDLTLEFGPHLNALTGETGAGDADMRILQRPRRTRDGASRGERLLESGRPHHVRTARGHPCAPIEHPIVRARRKCRYRGRVLTEG